ncbi:hypothetical protein ACJIZ3_020060 [Penstemon smallii]|uniref:Uncharacterized protein n=1 Tax=Penstemon smallii TaxID=265156 RepID=A0ABD3SHI8_9LAMI
MMTIIYVPSHKNLCAINLCDGCIFFSLVRLSLNP